MTTAGIAYREYASRVSDATIKVESELRLHLGEERQRGRAEGWMQEHRLVVVAECHYYVTCYDSLPMEASFVLYRLGPYLANRASRLIKSPKLFVGDSGLAAHLCGVTDLGPGSDEPARGALIETYVAQNLSAVLEAQWPEARLSFWHVQGRYEVDFVIEVGRECLAIEVKSASRWTKGDTAGLRAFLEKTPRCRAAILAHSGTAAVQLDDRLWALPLGIVLC